MSKPDMVMAGDVISTDAGDYELAMIIKFETEDQMKEAITTGKVDFTVFGIDQSD